MFVSLRSEQQRMGNSLKTATASVQDPSPVFQIKIIPSNQPLNPVGFETTSQQK